MLPALTLETGLHYLWGRDRTLDEPALGIAPPSLDLGARWQPEEDGYFLEAVGHLVARQDRVARARGEQPTPGYATLDLSGGTVLLDERVELRGGIRNLTDVAYADHLNARNPFTGQSIPEPGRIVHVDVRVAF